MRARRRTAAAWACALLLAAGALAQQVDEIEELPPTPEPIVRERAGEDERSAVLLRRECTSDLGRQELTLFANGTVRLREGPHGEERMMLGELPPDLLAGWVDVLRRENLSEAGPGSRGPGGDWVESCEVTLSYGAMERWLGPPPVREDDEDWSPAGDESFSYGPYDSLSLPLSRLVGLLDGLMERVDRAAGRQSLPPRYVPRRGDVLRRADGVLFRVVRQTADENGWEMQGVEQPLAIYIIESEVPKLFVELVERR